MVTRHSIALTLDAAVWGGLHRSDGWALEGWVRDTPVYTSGPLWPRCTVGSLILLLAVLAVDFFLKAFMFQFKSECNHWSVFEVILINLSKWYHAMWSTLFIFSHMELAWLESRFITCNPGVVQLLFCQTREWEAIQSGECALQREWCHYHGGVVEE